MAPLLTKCAGTKFIRNYQRSMTQEDDWSLGGGGYGPQVDRADLTTDPPFLNKILPRGVWYEFQYPNLQVKGNDIIWGSVNKLQSTNKFSHFLLWGCYFQQQITTNNDSVCYGKISQIVQL